MKFQKISLIFKLSICFVIYISSLYGCANVQAPTGGPKDTTPPKLTKVEPENMQTNFKSKKITLTFDKTVQLQNAQREVVITPEMSIAPTLMDKKNTIIVTINEDLKPNTTYVINFGKAIVDVTENNPAAPFEYIFSTSDQIDSLSVTGKLHYDIDTSKLENVFVGIYDIKTSDVTKNMPLWFTYTNKAGDFNFTHLKAGQYKIFAFTDSSRSKRFDYKELLAFLPIDIDLNKNISDLKLNLSKQVPDSINILDKSFKDEKICLTLNTSINPNDLEYLIENSTDIKLILENKNPTDTLCFFPSTLKFDSLEICVGNENIQYSRTVINNFNQDAKAKNVEITTNLESNTLTDTSFKLIFSKPISEIKTDNITLTEDSIQVHNFKIKEVERENNLVYIVDYAWKPSVSYELKIPTQSFKSIYGGENLDFNKNFSVNNSKDQFGTLKLNLTIPKDEQFLVQLYNSKNELIENKVINETTSIEFRRLYPGKYHIYFVKDLNKNSKWDLASFTKNIESEPVEVYPQPIDIRANWEFEQNYELH